MLMCLPLVTESLLYCRPSLALWLCSGQARSQSPSKCSLIRAPIHRHNWQVLSAVSRLLKKTQTAGFIVLLSKPVVLLSAISSILSVVLLYF